MSAINYDIASLISEHEKPAKLLFALWEVYASQPRDELLPAERVVLDAWNFDSTFGNGLNDLIANENYDTIANGMRALRLLGVQRLTEFADAAENAFNEHSICCASANDIAMIEQFPSEVRAQLAARLEETEKPFLQELWNEGIIISAARDYIDQHITTFEKRKCE